MLRAGDPCVVAEDAADLGPGGRVTIRNSAGEPIAVGSLGVAEVARDSITACVLRFEIANVGVQEGGIYGLELGTDRGILNYTQDELQAGIALVL